MKHSSVMAALERGETVDVSSFSASPGGTGGSPTTARRPGPGVGTERQPRPQNG